MFELYRLLKTCRSDINKRLASKQLHPDTDNYIKKYDANFGAVFLKAMEFDLSILSNDHQKSAASALIADYISQYILKPINILQNLQLNFASFYEIREKSYGLE